MTAQVVELHPATDPAADALAALDRHLERVNLSPHTKLAYGRQARAYVAWLATLEDRRLAAEAWVDVIGAEAAVAAWRRHLIDDRKSPSTINQALAAVTLLYRQGPNLRIEAKRARSPRPGEPDALEPSEYAAVERAADRRSKRLGSSRDAAIIALLSYSGARVEECTRLHAEDVELTARTGRVRLHGKGDHVRWVPLPAPARERLSAWLSERGNAPGPLWTGRRGPLGKRGITEVVHAVGREAGVQLHPHALRHTFATRLRRSGADPAQVQAFMGHASADTTARYYRAGAAELAEVVERAFES